MALCLCGTLDNYDILVMFLFSLKSFCIEGSQNDRFIFFCPFLVRRHPVKPIAIMTEKKMCFCCTESDKTSLRIELTVLCSSKPSYLVSTQTQEVGRGRIWRSVLSKQEFTFLTCTQCEGRTLPVSETPGPPCVDVSGFQERV